MADNHQIILLSLIIATVVCQCQITYVMNQTYVPYLFSVQLSMNSTKTVCFLYKHHDQHSIYVRLDFLSHTCVKYTNDIFVSQNNHWQASLTKQCQPINQSQPRKDYFIAMLKNKKNVLGYDIDSNVVQYYAPIMIGIIIMSLLVSLCFEQSSHFKID